MTWTGRPRFAGEVSVRFLPDGRKVCVENTVKFIDAYGYVWYAMGGLVCDGASIPSIAWPIIGGPFEGKHRDGAIMHDAAYAAQGVMVSPDGLIVRYYERADADRMLNEAMQVCGVATWKRRLIYSAVRTFGWWAWKQGRRAK